MRLRKMPDGSLIAIHRGKAPPCPDGYFRDQKNPYRFLIKLEDCEQREIARDKSGCCGEVVRMMCKGKMILRSDCLACKDTIPKISIIIINTGINIHLEKVLQSIFRQFLDNMEIIVVGGNAEELCKKYEAKYEPHSIDKALELITGEYLITTHSNICQVFDCVETLITPLLEDKTAICVGKVKSDSDGKYLEALEAKDFNNQELWESSPTVGHSTLYAIHRDSLKGSKGDYVRTDAWAIELGDKE